jgi:hypothetical protein
VISHIAYLSDNLETCPTIASSHTECDSIMILTAGPAGRDPRSRKRQRRPHGRS